MTVLFEKGTIKTIKICLGLGIVVVKCIVDNYDEIKKELTKG